MYKVGSFVFEIKDCNFKIPDNMKLFEVTDEICQYTYYFETTDHIEIAEKNLQVNKSNMKIYIKDNLEKRYINILGDPRIYAVCEELDETHCLVKVHRDFISLMTSDPMFVSLLSLERRVNLYHEYILHSAYMVIDDQAILFTAPSGTGKSTQASLWEKYRAANVINGDRCLLVKKNNQYYASGWPICGSSNICHNKSYPIKAIVVLSQNQENIIAEMSYVEKVKKLFREITVNYHNNEFFDNAMKFIDDLILNVNIYHLACDISENAVICLENKLKEVK